MKDTVFNDIGISVNIFGKNNEDCIEKALKSVQPFANEIVYLDTGSTDSTVEIVRKYTDKIFIQEVSPIDYSYCRNFLIGKSEMEWILAVDTDEVVTDELAQKIKGFLYFLKYIYRPINFVYFKWAELIYDEKHFISDSEFHPFLYHPRLYKRTTAEWVGTPHEQFKGQGEGMFWDIFGLIHFNLLMIDRLRNLKEGRQWAKDLPDKELADLYAHNAPVFDLPKGVTWLTNS
jgi:glycosyltransferase involved in cell wall biosynthesis